MKRTVLLITFVLLIFGGCELPNYFAEYYDSNGNPINLLDGYVLPTASDNTANQNTDNKQILIDGVLTTIPDPNSWDIITAAGGPPYLTFDYSGSATLPGPPAGADFYILEIADLAPAANVFFNAGNWNEYGPVPPVPGTAPLLFGEYEITADTLIDFNLLTSQSLWFEIAGRLADGPVNDATYSTALTVSYTSFKPYSPGTSWPVNTSGTLTTEEIYLSDFTFDPAGGSPSFPFSIGAMDVVTQQYSNRGSIQRIRAARTDINYDVVIYLTRFDEGRPPLIDGKYTFSIWVRNEAAAASDIESITLGITSTSPASNRAYFKSFNVSDFPGGWAGWTKISITTPTNQSMEIKDLPSSDYPAFRLTISPTYMNKILGGESILPGTLLFTSPELFLVTE